MQKSGKSTKRLDRLAPNLVNICRFIWEWTYAKNNLPLDTEGGIFSGFRLLKMQNSGQSTKRLDRLAPNVVHVWGGYLEARS